MIIDQFYDVILRANDLEFLVIQLIYPPEQSEFYDLVNVVLHTADHRKIIVHSLNYCLVDLSMAFVRNLQDAIDGKRELDVAAMSDISLRYIHMDFLAARDIDADTQAIFPLSLYRQYGVLYDMYLDRNWLYTVDGTLVLEATPRHEARAIDDGLQSWEDFRHKIQPLLANPARITFTRETAQRWIEQLQGLYTIELYNTVSNAAQFTDKPAPASGVFRRDYGDTESSTWRDYPVRALDTLDVCRYHPDIPETNPQAHAEFLQEVQRMYQDWLARRE